MAVNSYNELRQHIGHDIQCVCYGIAGQDPENIAVECQDCNEVLFEYDKPADKAAIRKQDLLVAPIKETRKCTGEQVMPRVNGLPFRCSCGCNVFTKANSVEMRCNSCRSRYAYTERRVKMQENKLKKG